MTAAVTPIDPAAPLQRSDGASSAAPRHDFRVAIIGAGFGGVAAAVYLGKAGFHDVTIYERTHGLGGVWHQNTYPGAEVDTFSDWYSYRFKHFDWPKPHAAQAVLEAYINETVDDYGLRERVVFGTSVIRATWDETRHLYDVELSDGRTEQFDVVISAVGLFNVPKYPEWPGLDTFAGPAFHASRYEHQHDFTGKRVAVVGAGSSGTQIVPELAGKVGHLVVFQRDPNWIAPKGDKDYTPEERARRQNPKVYRKARRGHWWAETKMLWQGRILREGTKENTAARQGLEAHIERILGDRPELKAAVMPDHPFFAKRPVKADGFYEALRRDDVTFRRSAVVEVTRDGLIDSTGEHFRLDAIVMATGYRVAEFLGEIEVVGESGLSIHDYWQQRGGAEAFLGMTVPGFPNFYMIYGPNTNMGQIVFNLETQARFIARTLRRMRRRRLTAVDTRQGAHRRFNDWLQRTLARTVWPEANNYLKDETSGKLVVPFPLPMMYYWAMTHLFGGPGLKALKRVAREIKRTAAPMQEASVPIREREAAE